MVVSDT